MKTIGLTVNGKAVTASVEPRTHLADFLRETLNLTGTHLGCEHGICGACTLNIDGAPARSCITLAVACDGASITTIEGFEEDPIMRALRDAFSREHGLQCGYCTPGMLVSARDVVMRLPDANERDIRVAMSGNLCRCTGYVGIVRAIERVLAGRKAGRHATPANSSITLGPAGSGHAKATASEGPAVAQRARPQSETVPAVRAQAAAAPKSAAAQVSVGRPQTTLRESFTVDYPREQVWAFFGRLGEVATCLPGTSVLGTPGDDHVETAIRVKVGPIVAEFEGAADVVRDPSQYSGVIHGSARDRRSDSTTRGEIRYALIEEKSGAATRVDVEVGYTLAGALAQFGRSGIVQDIARRMTDTFSRNVQNRLSGSNDRTAAEGTARRDVSELDAGSLILPVIWERIKSFFRGLFRR